MTRSGYFCFEVPIMSNMPNIQFQLNTMRQQNNTGDFIKHEVAEQNRATMVMCTPS
jgi:hypothetical protein